MIRDVVFGKVIDNQVCIWDDFSIYLLTHCVEEFAQCSINKI